jgi:hypothetical protein
MNNSTSPGTKRGFFYERTATDTQVIYRFKNTLLIYYVVGMGAILWLLTSSLRIIPERALTIYCAAAFFYFLVNFFAHVAPNREIREATKHGTVKVSGSKFSFKNPLTVIIDRTA